jgi:hypothetical protein
MFLEKALILKPLIQSLENLNEGICLLLVCSYKKNEKSSLILLIESLRNKNIFVNYF